MLTKSIALALVDNVGVPPANLTVVDTSVPNVAVLDPVASCLILIVTVCPVPRLAMLNPVLVSNVTVWKGANEQSTVIVDDEVKLLILSLYLSNVPTLDFAVSVVVYNR